MVILGALDSAVRKAAYQERHVADSEARDLEEVMSKSWSHVVCVWLPIAIHTGPT